MKISITDDGASRSLLELGKRVKNRGKALKEAATYMERELKMGFARQQDPDGAAWAPLSASTLRQKRSRSILRETSALMGSISTLSVSSDQARVGSAGIDYGIYHQTGTSKMPARKFIGIGAKHEAEIMKIFKRHLEL